MADQHFGDEMKAGTGGSPVVTASMYIGLGFLVDRAARFPPSFEFLLTTASLFILFLFDFPSIRCVLDGAPDSSVDDLASLEEDVSGGGVFFGLPLAGIAARGWSALMLAGLALDQ